MAKKRHTSARAGGKRSHDAAAADQDDGRRFKMKLDNYMDVADSEDEWDHERDKLLLDDSGPARKRQRQIDEYEDAMDGSDESALEIPGETDSDEEEEEDEEGDEEEDDEEESGEQKDDDDSRGRPGPEDEDGWGYEDAYGADVAQNEEDAKEIEAEAIRLQKKQRERLTEADFGFDETDWLGEKAEGDEEDGAEVDQDANGISAEIYSLASITKDTPPEERLRILKLRHPEFMPLREEYLSLMPQVEAMKGPAQDAMARYEKRLGIYENTANGVDDMNLQEPVTLLKYQALASYMAVLTMYFALLTSTADGKEDDEMVLTMDPKELREHPIMDTLIKHKSLWEEANDLPESESEEEPDEAETPEQADASEMSIYYTPQEQSFPDLPPGIKPRPKKLTKTQKAALKAQEAEAAKREARLKQLDKDMAKLSQMADAAVQKASKSKLPKQSVQTTANSDDDDSKSDSDFGDMANLTSEQAQEKAQKKKSLRFFTSQIAQRINKRAAASRDVGGDMDIPYRERLKDRQARLLAEAEARGKRKSGKDNRADELGGDSDDDDRAAAAALRGNDGGKADDDDDDYYQQIATSKAKKKAAKEARRTALREAEAWGGRVEEEEKIGPDGKRAVGYTIVKNKGLTQNRRKDVRNPRVKKRKRFEDKKKKLASMRPVFKPGGEGRGGYGGELTGIRTDIVRARKL